MTIPTQGEINILGLRHLSADSIAISRLKADNTRLKEENAVLKADAECMAKWIDKYCLTPGEAGIREIVGKHTKGE